MRFALAVVLLAEVLSAWYTVAASSLAGRCDEKEGEAGSSAAPGRNRYHSVYDEGAGCQAALSRVDVHATVLGNLAHVAVNHTYTNDATAAIADATLLLSVPSGSVLVDFQVSKGESVIVMGTVQGKAKADESPVCQRGDVFHDFAHLQLPGARKVPIGYLEVGAKVEVHFEFVQELLMKKGGATAGDKRPSKAAAAERSSGQVWQLIVPVPPPSSRRSRGVGSALPGEAPPPSMSMTLIVHQRDAVAASPAAGETLVRASTPGVEVKQLPPKDAESLRGFDAAAASGAAAFSLSSSSLQEISLEIAPATPVEQAERFQPELILERHPHYGTLAALLALPAALPPMPSGSLEAVLIVDRSPSMRGTRLQRVTKVAHTFVQSLPLGARFNLVGLATDAASAAPLFLEASKTLDEESFRVAKDHLSAAEPKAEQGAKVAAGRTADHAPGILKALEAVLKQMRRAEGTQLRIYLITDRHPGDADEAIKLVSEACRLDCRVSALGVGWGASPPFVEGLAKAGGGSAHFVAERGGASAMEKTLAGQLAEGLLPTVRDVRVDWSSVSTSISNGGRDSASSRPEDLGDILEARLLTEAVVSADKGVASGPWQVLPRTSLGGEASAGLPTAVAAGGRLLSLALLGTPTTSIQENKEISVGVTIGGQPTHATLRVPRPISGVAVHSFAGKHFAEELAARASVPGQGLANHVVEHVRNIGLSYSLATSYTHWVSVPSLQSSEQAEEKNVLQPARCEASRAPGGAAGSAATGSRHGAMIQGDAAAEAAASAQAAAAPAGVALRTASLLPRAERGGDAPKQVAAADLFPASRFGNKLSIADMSNLGSTLALKTMSSGLGGNAVRWGGSPYSGRTSAGLDGRLGGFKDSEAAALAGLATRKPAENPAEKPGDNSATYQSASTVTAQSSTAATQGLSGGRLPLRGAQPGAKPLALNSESGERSPKADAEATAAKDEKEVPLPHQKEVPAAGPAPREQEDDLALGIAPSLKLDEVPTPALRNAKSIAKSLSVSGRAPKVAAEPAAKLQGDAVGVPSGRPPEGDWNVADIKLTARLSVLDFANMGSSLSLRHVLPASDQQYGSGLGGYPQRAGSLSMLDFLFLGSSLALGGFGLAKRSASPSGLQRLGGGFGLGAEGMDDWREPLGLGSRDPANAKASEELSVRNFARMGSTVSLLSHAGMADTADREALTQGVSSRLSVVDFDNIGSSLSIRSLSRSSKRSGLGDDGGFRRGGVFGSPFGDDLGYDEPFYGGLGRGGHSGDALDYGVRDEARGGGRYGDMMDPDAPMSWVAVSIAGTALGGGGLVAPLVPVRGQGMDCQPAHETISIDFQAPAPGTEAFVSFYNLEPDSGSVVNYTEADAASPGSAAAGSLEGGSLSTLGADMWAEEGDIFGDPFYPGGLAGAGRDASSASAMLVAKVKVSKPTEEGAAAGSAGWTTRLSLKLSRKCELSARVLPPRGGSSSSSARKPAMATPRGDEFGFHDADGGRKASPDELLAPTRLNFGFSGGFLPGEEDLFGDAGGVGAGALEDPSQASERLRSALNSRRAALAAFGFPLRGEVPLDAYVEGASSSSSSSAGAFAAEDSDTRQYRALLAAQRHDGAFDFGRGDSDGLSEGSFAGMLGGKDAHGSSAQVTSAGDVGLPRWRVESLAAAWALQPQSAGGGDSGEAQAELTRLAAHTAAAVAVLRREYGALSTGWALLEEKAAAWLERSGAAVAAGCGTASACIDAGDVVVARWLVPRLKARFGFR
eukprot:TRINITY_DN61874_c0_g1_i1.p1 TRINITY_DN61874_c0_g1~~TRINITY_DN61874_c0_g1_i1.p1  ORF type:complete len:1753 (+),score=390.20 TRINITY_DN61874_c0_g1_i1:65-5323(+)